MNSKRQCDLFGHTASYINTSLQRLAIQWEAPFYVANQYAIVVISAYSGWETSSLDACATMGWSLSTSTA